MSQADQAGEPTRDELFAQYRAAELARLGIGFQAAMDNRAIRMLLVNSVTAARHRKARATPAEVLRSSTADPASTAPIRKPAPARQGCFLSMQYLPEEDL